MRAIRSAHRLASVAVSANDQHGIPNRRVSSAATHSASSVGSIVVMPPARPMRACDRVDHRGRRVPGHRPGVAEAEVDVLVAVDVGERGCRARVAR